MYRFSPFNIIYTGCLNKEAAQPSRTTSAAGIYILMKTNAIFAYMGKNSFKKLKIVIWQY
jgi:hypothetical protein